MTARRWGVVYGHGREEVNRGRRWARGPEVDRLPSADNESPGLFGWIRFASGRSADLGAGVLSRILRVDPVAIASLAALAGLVVFDVAALYFAVLAPWTWLTALLRPALAIVALKAGLSRLPEGQEHRFWNEIATAFVFWLVAWSVLLAVKTFTVVVAATAGVLFAAAFMALAVAVERPTGSREGVHRSLLDIVMSWSGGTVWILGLFFYFVVIPAFLDPVIADNQLQLFYMLLVVDGYVAGKLVYFGMVMPSARWRMVYSWLVLAVLGIFVNDLIVCLGVASGLPAAGAVSGLGWSVPFLFLVLAARLRHHPFPGEPSPDDESARPEELYWPRERLVAMALGFPFIHLLLHSTGLLGATGAQVRQVFVLVWLLVFGAMAFGQQRHLEKKVRRLWHENLRAEEAARDHERTQRLLREHQNARAALKMSEEKFNKALRAIPDPMLISTVADGKILEVNDSFLRHFGYSRDQVLGKTGVELKLWVEPEDRALMTRLLRERGAVRNLAFELTRQSGEKRMMLLSGEIIDLEGSTCFLTVLRDVTELESLKVSSL